MQTLLKIPTTLRFRGPTMKQFAVPFPALERFEQTRFRNLFEGTLVATLASNAKPEGHVLDLLDAFGSHFVLHANDFKAVFGTSCTNGSTKLFKYSHNDYAQHTQN